ncbi:MAG: hypothetical protein IIT70_05880, partial [Clostridia bacterium]|nr:hypothetical protein [Clostridia bacterium]
ECHTGSVDVSGSSPLCSTKNSTHLSVGVVFVFNRADSKPLAKGQAKRCQKGYITRTKGIADK